MRTKPKRYPFGIGLDVDDVETDPGMGLLAPNLTAKRDWRASAYDRVMPHGGSEMEDGDKSRMFRQGLLHLGAGLLSNGGGFGNALGKSISGGLLAMNKGTDDLADRQYKQQIAAHQMGDPTEFRAQDMMAQAAGHARGSQGYKDWMNRNNGGLAKESSAAIKYAPMKGDDGITRMVALDPNDVGAQVIGSGATYGSGVGQPQPSTRPPGVLDSAYRDSGNFADDVRGIVSPLGGRITSTTGGRHNVGSKHYGGNAVDIGMARETPEQQAQILAALQADPNLIVRDERTRPPGQKEWSGPHLHTERRGANPFESRPEEDQAARTQAATEAVTLGNLPRRGRIEADNVALFEQAKADAQASAGLANAPTVARTEATIEASKGQAGEAAKRYSEIQSKGMMARSENTRLIALRAALKSTYTGTGANQVLGLKKAAAAFGIDSKGLGEAQVAQALTNQLAMAMRNPAGGEGMPGAMSDADRKFLISSVPGLSNTPDGWRAMIDMRVALNDAATKQAKMAADLRRQGVPVQDIAERLQDYAEQNPVFQSGADGGELSQEEQTELDRLRKQLGRK